MASQREVDKKPGSGEVESDAELYEKRPSRNTESAPGDVRPVPWSDEDPQRPDRIAEAISETDAFLSQFRCEGVGYEDISVSEYQRLSENAQERKRWGQARKDAFTGLVRLAVPTPPRGRRVL